MLLDWTFLGFGERSHSNSTDYCTGVLDIFLSIDFSPACAVHDRYYPWKNIRQKLKADALFYRKMCRCVNEDAVNPFHAWIGYNIAFIRFFTVAFIFGWFIWSGFPWTGKK